MSNDVRALLFLCGVIVHEATVGENLAFGRGEVGEVQLDVFHFAVLGDEIGRASCRERG